METKGQNREASLIQNGTIERSRSEQSLARIRDFFATQNQETKKVVIEFAGIKENHYNSLLRNAILIFSILASRPVFGSERISLPEDNSQKTEQFYVPEHMETAEGLERSERSEDPEYVEGLEDPERSERSEDPELLERAEGPERSEAEGPDGTERTEGPEQSEGVESPQYLPADLNTFRQNTRNIEDPTMESVSVTPQDRPETLIQSPPNNIEVAITEADKTKEAMEGASIQDLESILNTDNAEKNAEKLVTIDNIRLSPSLNEFIINSNSRLDSKLIQRKPEVATEKISFFGKLVASFKKFFA